MADPDTSHLTSEEAALLEALTGHLAGYDIMADRPDHAKFWFVHPDEIRHVLDVFGSLSEERGRVAERDAEVERLRDALAEMMNEHTPLGQHENGEIEFCQGEACRKAGEVLAALAEQSGR